MAMNRDRPAGFLFRYYQCLPFRCGGNVFIIFFPEMCQVNKAKMYTDENKLRVK